MAEVDNTEIKDLLEENLALTQETNRLVHKMRRTVIWGRIFQVVWWIIVFLVAGGAYYYYAQPYIAKIEQWYTNTAQGREQAQSIGGDIENFIKNISPSQPSQ